MFSSDIDKNEINKRIKEFRALAERGISKDECIDRVSYIFGEKYSFPAVMSHYPEGTIFYRARAIKNDDTNLPLRAISKVSDAWEPPESVVTYPGRLNSVGQSILYCCPANPDLAIDEARARSNNHAAVMVYRSIRSVKVAVLGDYKNSTLPKDDMSHIFFSFLEEEFGREVETGHENRYIITRAIADTFFNYPEQDAWCYRSVQAKEKFNTAFLPGRSQLCLQLVGVLICDLRNSIPNNLSIKMVVDFDNLSGEARYHPIGSEGQKRIFSEIE